MVIISFTAHKKIGWMAMFLWRGSPVIAVHPVDKDYHLERKETP
jgi:hypothetical protein